MKHILSKFENTYQNMQYKIYFLRHMFVILALHEHTGVKSWVQNPILIIFGVRKLLSAHHQMLPTPHQLSKIPIIPLTILNERRGVLWFTCWWWQLRWWRRE